jgi:preprotein translocase subunit SecE
MSRITNYFKDTAAEMKHVKWPTQKQAFAYTALVIAVSAIVAVYLGIVDYLFTQILNIFVN